MRVCCKCRNDSWLSATGNNHNTHTKHRRHCTAHVPDDGNWRIRLHVAGTAAQAGRDMVHVRDQRSHMYMQLHRVRDKDAQRLLQEKIGIQGQETCRAERHMLPL